MDSYILHEQYYYHEQCIGFIYVSAVPNWQSSVHVICATAAYIYRRAGCSVTNRDVSRTHVVLVVCVYNRPSS